MLFSASPDALGALAIGLGVLVTALILSRVLNPDHAADRFIFGDSRRR